MVNSTFLSSLIAPIPILIWFIQEQINRTKIQVPPVPGKLLSHQALVPALSPRRFQRKQQERQQRQEVQEQQRQQAQNVRGQEQQQEQERGHMQHEQEQVAQPSELELQVQQEKQQRKELRVCVYPINDKLKISRSHQEKQGPRKERKEKLREQEKPLPT